MISIIVDEGYAYDFLAILEIKGTTPNYHRTISAYIEAQVGRNLHLEILMSEEFEKLIDANEKTFNAVEMARYGDISAKEVDKCNIERYNCKVALQNRFFPNQKFVETKT